MQDDVKDDIGEAMCKISEFFGQAGISLSVDKGTDADLIASGLLDSLNIVQLAMFVSTEMRVDLDDEDFTEENFSTLGSLARLIAAKRQAQNNNALDRL